MAERMSRSSTSRTKSKKQSAAPLSLTPATSYPTIVGSVLARERERKHITQAQLADQMSLAASTWSRIENGASALTVDQLAMFAALVGTTPGALLNQADAVVQVARQQNVRVEPTRIDNEDVTRLGLLLLGAAAISALAGLAIAAGLPKQR